MKRPLSVAIGLMVLVVLTSLVLVGKRDSCARLARCCAAIDHRVFPGERPQRTGLGSLQDGISSIVLRGIVDQCAMRDEGLLDSEQCDRLGTNIATHHHLLDPESQQACPSTGESQ